ncbi:tail fiber domain-containing protein [Stenotrophomonas geniculata]|uniref:Tail fiber domain-containing protein n=1 Tax=Stenotrophomonas geniculata TaxID=86188 RepID=A0ABW1MX91_9GAMM
MPKYADPSVFPVGTPAATDNVMTRTAAGADGNFALGNLAGIAGAAVATDQSVYLGSSGWASYSLTAAGRALSGVAGTANTFPYFSATNVVTLGSVTSTGLSILSAANQAAARTAIQAVGTVGDDTVAGVKTFTGASVRIQNPGAGFWLDEGAATDGAYFVLNNATLQIQARAANFGGFTRSLAQILVNGTRTSLGGTEVSPLADNTQTLGSGGRRWTTVYAVNSTINTSDARLKTEPRQLRDAELKAASAIARLPAVWRWLSRVHGDENCEPEGMDARKHFGPTVQAAMAVMEAHGLDPFAYSFICYDEWEAEPEQWHEWPAKGAVLDEDGNELEPAVEAGRELIQPAREAGDRYSFRKEELLCFVVSALAAENDAQAAKIEAMDARLAAVEARA